MNQRIRLITFVLVRNSDSHCKMSGFNEHAADVASDHHLVLVKAKDEIEEAFVNNIGHGNSLQCGLSESSNGNK